MKLRRILKKYWFEVAVFLILLFASLLRFYKLGVVPHGMTWDEAAIGYNGYAIMTTRRDEWLNKLPVSFMSFGDFKAPLAIYLNGLFTYLFGLNLFAVRLPFTIISILAILGMILLTLEVLEQSRYKQQLALFAGFLLTFSPWHLHYSRTGFESGIALAFIIWALLFFIKWLKGKFRSRLQAVLTVLFFVLSIYTYHSAKIFVPLLGLSFLIIFFKEIRQNFKYLLLPLILFISLLVPFIYDSLLGEGLTRAGVTIFSSQLSLVSKLLYVLQSLATHLSFKFLVLAQTTTLRHGTGYLGVLFFTTYILVIAGVVALFRAKRKKPVYRYQLVFALIIILGILPASVALEVPHSNRALLALPGFILTAVFGLEYLANLVKRTSLNKSLSGSYNEKNIVVKSLIGTLLVTHLIFSIAFISNYFTEFNKLSSNDFNDGYLEAFRVAKKYEKGEGVEKVDKIVFTSKYGQPYIYALFVRKTNPIWYRGGSLVKYEFKDNINVGDLIRNNALIVASGSDDLPTQKADYIIYGQDGSVRFKIYRTR